MNRLVGLVSVVAVLGVLVTGSSGLQGSGSGRKGSSGSGQKAASGGTSRSTAKKSQSKKPQSQKPPAGLTESERKVWAKFGDQGVRIWRLIDGKRTAAQIMEEAGVTEERLMEVLRWGEQQGYLTLDAGSDGYADDREKKVQDRLGAAGVTALRAVTAGKPYWQASEESGLGLTPMRDRASLIRYSRIFCPMALRSLGARGACSQVRWGDTK